MGYLYVKDLLGDSLFTNALHTYIRNWNGKHPIPYDFFNSMNAGSGKDLNWFWKKWFFDGGYADLAISSVVKKSKGYVVTVTSKGTKPVPVDINVTYSDNSTTTIHRTVAVWESGAKSVTVTLPGSKKIKKITLGSTWVPDRDKKDNVYEVK
jgi:aminopeptidase N